MRASSLILQLTAAALGARRVVAHSLATAVCLCALGWAVAQAPPAQVGPGREPITPIPPAPVQDPRRLALGDRLFHDPRLSHDNTLSCNSCHDLATNGAEASRPKSKAGSGPDLNTPTVFNAALSFRLNWEGDVRTLEGHVEQTLRSPRRLGSSLDEALQKLRADKDIAKAFREAYGREMDGVGILAAVATYERSLLTPGSRFDLWLEGDANAMTPKELDGYRLFKSLGCISCHQGVNIGGNMYQRHGVFHPLGSPKPEIVRVPSLRNVAVTPPYFHDGSAATLFDAVKTMGHAQLDRMLTDDQTEAIVAFLKTLTGTYRGKPLVRANEPRPSGAPP
ncbi:MAG: c-type cytochrome [Hyphomicrobiales bacterium]|nr:c-type cytochrome [Hyphomicrobiales bacterium]MBV8288453.1 c-type cytochrome [Hyphomicrobiales bacterium]